MHATRSQLQVIAPLSGVRVALAQVPDPVFAQKIVGDGAAIDPTSCDVLAPVSGTVLQLHAAGHALSLRHTSGVEVLVHIGIDTVKLGGTGFTALVVAGDVVELGQPLIRFDLDAVARGARSLLTQVLIANMDRVSALEFGRGALTAGASVLFTATLNAKADCSGSAEAATTLTQRSAAVPLPNPAGLHARPAAVLAACARGFAGEVRLHLGSTQANAKSVVAILGLGTRHGDRVWVEASGAEAESAVAALMKLLASGCGESVDASARVPARTYREAGIVAATTAHPNALSGVPAAPGIAFGRVMHWRHAEIAVAEHGATPGVERARLDLAVHTARNEITALQAQLADPVRAGILDAHLGLLEDPDLLDPAHADIARGSSAGFAWRAAVEAQAGILAGLDNPLLRERAADVRDVGRRVLAQLGAAAPTRLDVPAGSILIAEELSPSDTAQLDRARVLGFCTVSGGATSHVAILARSMGIPAICGMDAAVLNLADGEPAILDGDRGRLLSSPSAAEVATAEQEMAAARQHRIDETASAQRIAITRDGVRIEVVANVRNAEETIAAIAVGAEGVGLLRTEFLFDEREQAPSEEEQVEAYTAVARVLGPTRPLVIRTLDVGGDKPLAYLPLPREDNPFLGLRGVRVSLQRTDLLRTQLRALLRSQAPARLHLLLPMVTTLDELRAIKSVLAEESLALGCALPPLGIMIEVPAAALLAEHFAREVEFFSIGSNDLTQYTLAMDRGHPQLAKHADALHPAVLKLIALTCAGASQHGRWVGICGGIASDPQATALLIGLGITELSVAAPAVAAIKAALSRVSMEECGALARDALAMGTATEVRARVGGRTN